MIVHASKSTRHVIARLGTEDVIPEALGALMRAQRGSTATVLSAHGVLRSARLDAYDPRGRCYGDPRTLGGSLELLSLSGHLVMRDGAVDCSVHAAVARDLGNGVEVIGGRLVEAGCVAVELTLLIHDDLALERVADGVTGVSTLRGVTSAVEPREAEAPRESKRPPSGESPGARPTLAEVAKMLEARGGGGDDSPDGGGEEWGEATGQVSVGDWLLHPSFGEVRVTRETEPGHYDIKMPRSGAFRRMRLDPFEIRERGQRDGQVLWELRLRRK